MSTILSNVFSINGIVDTSQSVLQNMNTLASAAGAWVTYDINQGKWAVIINQAGSSISSFTDSNIIGGISVSSTGLTELYNSVEIEFPNADILDQKDYIKFEIPSGDRFPNEPDNELQIQMDIINNSVQAELIASRELKQSRVDKIIEFRTDFTKLGLKAGDLIDVTNSALGWTAKVFRIMKIVEEDADDGVFTLSIQALEYNADVYSTSGLTRTARSVSPEITAKKNNTAVTSADTGKTTNDLSDSLTDPANLALAISLMSALAPNSSSGRANTGLAPRVFNFQTGVINFTEFIFFNNTDSVFANTAASPAEFYNLGTGVTLPFSGYYQIDYYINCGASNIATISTGNFLIPMTIRKRGGIAVSINGAFPELLSVTTVVKGEDVFADITNSSVDYYTAGTTLQFFIYYRHNLENNNLVEYPINSGDYYAINSFTGYSTPVHFGLITGNVSFVGS